MAPILFIILLCCNDVVDPLVLCLSGGITVRIMQVPAQKRILDCPTLNSQGCKRININMLRIGLSFRYYSYSKRNRRKDGGRNDMQYNSC